MKERKKKERYVEQNERKKESKELSRKGLQALKENEKYFFPNEVEKESKALKEARSDLFRLLIERFRGAND